MTPHAEAVGVAVDARIARAQALAVTHPAAATLLDFYARLARWQRSLLPRAPEVVRELTAPPPTLAAQLDLPSLAACVPNLLAWLGREAPATLKDTAQALAAVDADTWRVRLAASLEAPETSSGESGEAAGAAIAFVCDAVTQPFAEIAARVKAASPSAETSSSGTSGTPAQCPHCQAPPVAGVLRERGHGAHRALVCGRCLTEWAAPRLLCPACGAVDVQTLPVFRADAWPAVRLDACEGCRAYLKSVDLTLDGRAIAVVDDLATLSFDLWAAEQGFHRRRPNLLGL